MKPRAIHATAANRRRHHRSDENRRSSHPTPHGLAGDRQRPAECSATGIQHTYRQTMRRLRLAVGLLSALLLASLAHAVIDGLTPGLALALALTAMLLVASLELWRIGSRRAPHDTAPPRGKR
jgi:hypothetical protein